MYCDAEKRRNSWWVCSNYFITELKLSGFWAFNIDVLAVNSNTKMLLKSCGFKKNQIAGILNRKKGPWRRWFADILLSKDSDRYEDTILMLFIESLVTSLVKDLLSLIFFAAYYYHSVLNSKTSFRIDSQLLCFAWRTLPRPASWRIIVLYSKKGKKWC